MIHRNLIKIFYKINIIRFVFQTIKYRIKIGNYVNFNNQGKIIFTTSNITIRDHSEVVVVPSGELIVEDNVFIGKNVEIGAEQMRIGRNTSIQNNCILLGNISIGKNCSFGPSIYVSSGFHYFRYRPELLIKDQDILANRELGTAQNKITVEDDIWIGKNVVIVNNVTVGKGSVIGANSFINKDVAPYSIVAGSPQKVIGMRLDFQNNIPGSLNGSLENHFPYFYSGFDYSLASFNTLGFVTIIDHQVSFYIKNKLNQRFITITLNNTGNNEVLFSNGEQHIQAYRGEQQLKFDISASSSDKYVFEIEGNVTGLLVKHIYFND